MLKYKTRPLFLRKEFSAYRSELEGIVVESTYGVVPTVFSGK